MINLMINFNLDLTCPSCGKEGELYTSDFKKCKCYYCEDEFYLFHQLEPFHQLKPVQQSTNCRCDYDYRKTSQKKIDYRLVLIDFMKKKREVIARTIHDHNSVAYSHHSDSKYSIRCNPIPPPISPMVAKLYFNSKDEESIKKWDKGESEQIYLKLVKHIVRGAAMGLTHLTCPFCIKHHENCINCKYGEHHGKCNSDLKEFSAFKSNFRQLVDLKLCINGVVSFISKAFTIEVYRSIINSIQEKMGKGGYRYDKS